MAELYANPAKTGLPGVDRGFQELADLFNQLSKQVSSLPTTSGGGSGTDPDAIHVGDAAGGGLGGTYPNPTVDPAAGLDTSAIHSGDAAGGGLGGTYPNPSVTPAAGLDTDAIHDGDAAGGGLGGTYPNPTVTPAAGLDTSAIHTGDAAGGALTGTYPNPTLATTTSYVGMYGISHVPPFIGTSTSSNFFLNSGVAFTEIRPCTGVSIGAGNCLSFEAGKYLLIGTLAADVSGSAFTVFMRLFKTPHRENAVEWATGIGGRSVSTIATTATATGSPITYYVDATEPTAVYGYLINNVAFPAYVDPNCMALAVIKVS